MCCQQIRTACIASELVINLHIQLCMHHVCSMPILFSIDGFAGFLTEPYDSPLGMGLMVIDSGTDR